MRILVSLVLILSLISFSTRESSAQKVPKTTDTPKDKAFVFGRVLFEGSKKISPDDLKLHFNERALNTLTVKPDADGYFSIALPLTSNFLARINYHGRHSNIATDYAVATVHDATKVYYLGDITFTDWWPENKDRSMQKESRFGRTPDSDKEQSKPKMQVASNPATIEHFKAKYPANAKPVMTDSLMVIRRGVN